MNALSKRIDWGLQLFDRLAQTIDRLAQLPQRVFQSPSGSRKPSMEPCS